jgi:hypothetical protein
MPGRVSWCSERVRSSAVSPNLRSGGRASTWYMVGSTRGGRYGYSFVCVNSGFSSSSASSPPPLLPSPPPPPLSRGVPSGF